MFKLIDSILHLPHFRRFPLAQIYIYIYIIYNMYIYKGTHVKTCLICTVVFSPSFFGWGFRQVPFCGL